MQVHYNIHVTAIAPQSKKGRHCMTKKPKSSDSEDQRRKLQEKLHTDSLTQDELAQLCTILLGSNWANKCFNQMFENALIDLGFPEPISYFILPREDVFLENGEFRKPSMTMNPSTGTRIYAAERKTYEGELGLLYLLCSYEKRPTRSPTTNFDLYIWNPGEHEKISLEVDGPLYRNLCNLHMYISNSLKNL